MIESCSISVVSHKTVVILHTLGNKATGVAVQSIQILHIIFITTFTWETRGQGRTESFGI